jgi:GDP-D-mannose dehydratase
MSHVKVSFDSPEYVANVDGIGTLTNFGSRSNIGFEKKPECIKLTSGCMVVARIKNCRFL